MARPRRSTAPEDPPDYELDLHGLTGEGALRRLAQELHAWRLSGVRRALVITGRGKQSENGPVLAPMLERWLESAAARAAGIVEWKPAHHGGAFEVRMDWGARDGRDEAR